jgi:hypothetical protein
LILTGVIYYFCKIENSYEKVPEKNGNVKNDQMELLGIKKLY